MDYGTLSKDAGYPSGRIQTQKNYIQHSYFTSVVPRLVMWVIR